MASASDRVSKYPPEILDNYNLKETIGTGGFAKVKLARHKMTGEKVAIKVMEKERLARTNDLKRVALEIEALKQLRHQNISRLYHAVETDERWFLVLEYAPGGELFDYIVARERCREDEARSFFREICCAVHHCHINGIVHRDLKPENLLLDRDQHIKLIDFGLIAHPDDIHTSLLKTCCGSAAYAAPELIAGKRYLGEPADMWSLGILLYALLCGFLPFDDDNTQRLYQLIQKGEYEIPPWLSEGSQGIIGCLLKHNPARRITMDKLLQHPWMLQGLSVKKIDPSSTVDLVETGLDQEVVDELAKFYGISSPPMHDLVMQLEYDHITAEYELLKLRKSKGHHINLPVNRGKLSPQKLMLVLKQAPTAGLAPPVHFPGGSGRSSPALEQQFGSQLHLATGSTDDVTTLFSGPYMHLPGSTENLIRLQRESAAAPGAFSGADASPSGRARSNTISARPQRELPALPPLQPAGSLHDIATASTEAELRRVNSNPGLSSPIKPRAAAPAVELPTPVPLARTRRTGSGRIKSLARSVINMFGSSRTVAEPRRVKGMFTAGTTSTKPAQEVLMEVLRVLGRLGYEVREKGFLVKAQKVGEDGKPLVAINIEVCRPERMDIIGLRFKRVKGDTWEYKHATQEIVSQLRL
eukprot:m.8640 g.8640  ORF g.8640 m.8640 type:complete len:643 (-) comp5382_c0_seq1:531-2459(-)